MLEAEDYKTIAIAIRNNGVAVATLNRPDKRNAVDDSLHEELASLSRDADADARVKVLVITGAGRGFCAGGDFAGGLTPGAHMWQVARQVVENLLACTKPVIAAVNGHAMGLGATVALLADIVIAARSAEFADTHAPMALGAGDGGQVIWPLLVGVNRAKYYLMTGDRIGADEAERIGLVNFVVDDEQLMARAMEIADRLASGAGLAISASKVPINRYIKMVCDLVLPLSLELEESTLRSNDFAESVSAFMEKRTPRFTGS